ncbi:uracil-xanthine permease [Desulfosporosinus acidiphilus SJ4]|uniref:Uracil-xanthine permease n=1 Tax=Desulfosporosinus acidiphilus (strain DSM 22704 / JCM 16185 / SJ4) TaxID=646529 RepID=I4D9U7_DESAJ|nr:solute carrier family 23 protein [Desulfosporosinus acidiphilus]AFM42571.1 uracil-xanthine permease [Desulfosporosinus acidiphilus SJ4]
MMNEVQINERLPLTRAIPLGVQHLFAMTGSTILVPFLVGLNPATALFCSGIGTIVFLLLTRSKVPAYLGSSFAFIASLTAFIKDQHNLGSAMAGVLSVGIAYLLIFCILRLFGTKWIHKLIPPVVAGSVVAIIGLSLTPTAVQMASSNWIIAVFTLAVAALISVYGKGFSKVIPVLIAIVAGYILAGFMGLVDSAKIVASFKTPFVLPFQSFGAIHLDITAILTFAPLALITLIEDLGHMMILGNITHTDIIEDPGFDKVVLGNGLATGIASLFGGVPLTTYAENIGVLAITKVYSSLNLWIAAIAAIILSTFNPLQVLIMSIPTAVMGGVVVLLFGMIGAAGLRTLIEAKVDFSSNKNLIIAAVIFAVGIGEPNHGIMFATLAGIFLNLILKEETGNVSNKTKQAAK